MVITASSWARTHDDGAAQHAVFDIKMLAEMRSRPRWIELLFAKFLLDITNRTHQKVSKLLLKIVKKLTLL